MSMLESKEKGAITVGRDPGSAPGFAIVKPAASGEALVSDLTLAEGLKFVPTSSLLDPRDVFRFSMIHNVGVTGGG